LSFILLKAIKEKKYLTRDRFVSFNSYILYWHFVDYVWLFVWYFIYLWATI
jgi:heme/copper-type cytochrome/quinol oxidase subunit 3